MRIIQRLIPDVPAVLGSRVGIGSAVNVAAVLVGGGIGTLAGARLPQGMCQSAMQAIGIVTLLVGVANFPRLDTTSTQTAPRLTLVTTK